MNTQKRIAAAVCFAGLLAAAATVAQAPGIKRTLLQRVDIGNNMEVITAVAEIAPGSGSGRHSHPGTETGYVISGTSVLEIDGEPAKTLNAGDSYVTPNGKIHNAKAIGDAPAKVLAIYIVEKGKPLSTPAP